jgi:hypothetical protein
MGAVAMIVAMCVCGVVLLAGEEEEEEGAEDGG